MTQLIWWSQLTDKQKIEAIKIWKNSEDGMPDHRKKWSFSEIDNSSSVIQEIYNEIKQV